MRRKIVVLILVLLAGVALFTLSGCKQNENSVGNNTVNGTGEHTIVSNLELGKKQYIEQLKKVQINGSEDYIIITEQRKWEVPEHEAGTTVSFAISIPYTIHVDGKDYSSECIIGDNSRKGKDENPKYSVEVTNLTKNYETEILINKK